MGEFEKLRHMAEFIRYVIEGNTKQIKRVVEKEQLNMPGDLYDIRGFAVKLHEPVNGELINTREWNSCHFAVWFGQKDVLQYFVDELEVNLKLALDYHNSANEYFEDTMFQSHLGSQTHIFPFLLAIYAKNMSMLTYLYETLFP